jgi:uncharacterized protein (TIGR03435 family)
MPDDSRERARLGPKDADGEPLCGNPYGELSSNEVTIGYVSPLDLMLAYVQPFVDLPILDEKGLRGSFQWTISCSPSASIDAGADPAATSIWTALQEQLGLKLEPQSRPTQVLLIDSVEMPTPN